MSYHTTGNLSPESGVSLHALCPIVPREQSRTGLSWTGWFSQAKSTKYVSWIPFFINLAPLSQLVACMLGDKVWSEHFPNNGKGSS